MDEIARRSLNLNERLSLLAVTSEQSEIVRDVALEERLERWKLVAAKGDASSFARRLGWSGLDLEQVMPALAPLPLGDVEAPAWLGTLHRIEANAREAAPGSQALPPFEVLVQPMIIAAWEGLFEALDPRKERAVAFVREQLERSAVADLERGLFDDLLNLCRGTFATELDASRQAPATFVREQLSAGLRSLFSSYPALARLIATRIDHWVIATHEFLTRFAADRVAIVQRLRPEAAAAVARIVHLQPGLSDPHHGGRTVITLELEGGLRLAYKPRSLALEAAYYQLLAWCNDAGGLLPLRILEVIEREGYGWMEFVEHAPCADGAAAGRFFERAGMILCLLYVLGTNDCHQENLIASGEHLLLIDGETAMHAEAREQDRDLMATAGLAISSVLRVGLLPRWEFSKARGGVYDVSGLGGGHSSSAASEHEGQPGETVAVPQHGNVPRIGDVPVSPNDHVAELVRGFEHMYRLLLRRRASLAAETGPLARFRGQPIRFVHRHTRVYWTILRHSLEPRFLRDGVSRSIELEVLGRAYLVAEDDAAGKEIFAAELRALERMDIPYFWTESDGTLVIDSIPVMKDAFEPNYERVQQRLQALDESDLRVQVGMIRGALFARVARAESPRPGPVSPEPESDELRPLTREDAIAAASRIAAELRAQAIEVPGGATWVGLLAEPRSSRIRFELVGSDLYNGRSGIALFLAGLHRVAGDEAARELALLALEPTRKLLSQTPRGALASFAKRLGLGAIVGVGSLLYAFVRVAELLELPELLVDAERACGLIDAELVEWDRQLDVTHGAAGALLACLALHRTGHGGDALAKARLCGEHLLRQAEPGPPGSSGWKTLPNRPALTGFAHGAAGISHALLRLHAVTDEERFGDAARAGMQFEHQLYMPEAENWPDLRGVRDGEGQVEFMFGWCTGPAGIGLGRLGGLEIERSQVASEDLEAALKVTRSRCWGPRDDLCCGTLGQVELLVEAGRRLQRPELLLAAATRAAAVVARAERAGRYSLFDELPDGVYNPGFFRGMAGIGYGLLRVVFSEELPSVLSLA